jgi:hypothetical protein
MQEQPSPVVSLEALIEIVGDFFSDVARAREQVDITIAAGVAGQALDGTPDLG